MTSDFIVPSNWYQTFFTDPVMRFWEAAIPQAATAAEVAFVIRHAGVHPPATVLDVPCGTGRHALALAKAGFTVTGIDLADAALERAEKSARAAGVAVRFLRSNMLELGVEEPRDALICMGNSLGYFEPALTGRLLRKFASALRVGGHLLLDTGICAESLLPLAAERSFSFHGGTYQQQMTYDATHSIIKTRAQLTIDGNRQELRYRHFVMTSGELVRALRSAGFAVRALYGSTDDAPFGPGSPRLLLVAVRE
jgi:2-polyprenyl-3-methyl-5-hydroxy-6-metoxy-1,4-benzoquinol methylase